MGPVRGLAALGALLLGVSGASAATIGGTYDVNPALAVTSVTDKTSDIAAHGASSANYAQLLALGNMLGILGGGGAGQNQLTLNESKTAFSGSDPSAYFKGTFASAVFNNAGNDLLLFESGDDPIPTDNQFEYLAVSATGLAGSWVSATLLGFLSAAQLGGPAGATTYGTYVFGFDLALLGVAVGDSVTSLFFGNTCGVACNGGGNNPDLVWIGGVTGAEVAAVPVPAGLPLLAAGLGALGLIGWRKKSAKP